MSQLFRVLVIDDDPGVRDYMEALVSRQGYDVLAVADGEQALQSLETSTPDLITLDVVLPGMDGLQTLSELKKRLPSVPVVMLSGHGQARNIVEAMRLGASDFLRKPFEVEERQRHALAVRQSLDCRIDALAAVLRLNVRQLIGGLGLLRHIVRNCKAAA